MKNSFPKIVITGGLGQLASALSKHPALQEFPYQLFSRSEVDITNATHISEMFLKAKPDIVVNTAAYTAVDKAETEIDAALQVNVNGTKNLALECQKAHIPLIHISTDYVFDGTKTSPYHENDTVNPINYYGKSKYLSELAVREHCDEYIILRVSGVFSEYGNNFFKTIMRLAQTKKELQIVADQIACPTYASDIAGAICKLLHQKKFKGTYHFCSKQAVSWHQFASEIIAEMKTTQAVMVENIKTISAAEYQSPAKRPTYSVLDCSRIKNDFGIDQPVWQNAIKTILSNLNQGK